MTHLWVREEPRENEQRVGLTPSGAAELIAQGFKVTVEDDPTRIIPIAEYKNAGADIAGPGTWQDAPVEAIIFGLKELTDDGSPLRHRHIMFGHAYKGQRDGPRLLERFKAGGGVLLDLEYLVDETGRRVAAFGYWAGYVGAALTLMNWGKAQSGGRLGPVDVYASPEALLAEVRAALRGKSPSVIVIGALGRVGGGASDVARALDLPLTPWDVAETARGAPFPEILDHDVFLNCILASPGVPIFVPSDAPDMPRKLSAIGDIACDPGSDYSPVPVYDSVTSWTSPIRRVSDAPILDVMAIDNLPSLLPREASEEFAEQLLPSLKTLASDDHGVWARATEVYRAHS